VDNFYISHFEKDFSGGAGGREGRVVHYWGTLSSQWGLDYIVIVSANDSDFSLSN